MPKKNGNKACQSAIGKQALKKFTIAISGNFGEQRSVEQMKRWIHANGGTFAADISPEVTHLVCSKEHFKKGVAMGMAYCICMEGVLIQFSLLVRKARKIRAIKIISWDWLEDTLMKGRPVQEFEYLMGPLVKCATETKEKKKAVRKENIKKGSKSSRIVVYLAGTIPDLITSGEVRERMPGIQRGHVFRYATSPPCLSALFPPSTLTIPRPRRLPYLPRHHEIHL